METLPRPTKLDQSNIEIIRIIIMKPTLARMLKLIDENDAGIATSELLYKMHLTAYGLHVLRQAEKEGFVKREGGATDRKIINKVTSKGHHIAEFVRDIGLWEHNEHIRRKKIYDRQRWVGSECTKSLPAQYASKEVLKREDHSH